MNETNRLKSPTLSMDDGESISEGSETSDTNRTRGTSELSYTSESGRSHTSAFTSEFGPSRKSGTSWGVTGTPTFSYSETTAQTTATPSSVIQAFANRQLPNRQPSEYHDRVIATPAMKERKKKSPATPPISIPTKHKKRPSAEKPRDPLNKAKTGRKLFVMRHAERMDRVFPDWLKLAYDAQDDYRPYDLNQPLQLPKRAGGRRDFYNDCPITEMGYVAAQMVGRALRFSGLKLIALYSSPALRCIQTSRGLLKTLGSKLKIRLEPGLFEWMGWYETPPIWLTMEECRRVKYDVDPLYKPAMSAKELRERTRETFLDHMKRMSAVGRYLLNTHKEPGVVMIVAHGTTLDACCRPMLGRKPTDCSREEREQIGLNYPFCSIVAQEENVDGTWQLMESALPSITYLDFSNRFSLKFFNR